MTIKEIRTKTGLTQRQFAKLLEIPYWTLVDWEHERRKPAPYLVKLMDFYLEKTGGYKADDGYTDEDLDMAQREWNIEADSLLEE